MTKLILNVLHDDGRFEQIPLNNLEQATKICQKYLSFDKNTKIKEEKNEPTKRIIQIMEVIKEFNNCLKESKVDILLLNDKILSNTINKIYRDISNTMKITIQTIADKTQRQLDYSKSEFSEALADLFINCKTIEEARQSKLIKRIYEVGCKSIYDNEYVDNVLLEIFN